MMVVRATTGVDTSRLGIDDDMVGGYYFMAHFHSNLPIIRLFLYMVIQLW